MTDRVEDTNKALVERRAPSGRAVADDLKRWLKILVALQVLTAVSLVGVVIWFAHQTTIATDALCNLRASEVRTLRQGKDFLLKHPNGGFGFSRAAIEKIQAESVKTIKALDTLGCPATPIDAAGIG